MRELRLPNPIIFKDVTVKNKESIEASRKVQELNKKLKGVRGQIKKLSGIDFNKEEQQIRLNALNKQLQLKRELIQKYKDIGNAAAFFNGSSNLPVNGVKQEVE